MDKYVKVVCAWCKLVIYLPPLATAKISHGICKDCAKKLEEES
jgi:hypothetical protein